MKLEFSQEQIDFIFSLLDSKLKQTGLESLVPVVDIYNVLIGTITKEQLTENKDNEKLDAID